MSARPFGWAAIAVAMSAMGVCAPAFADGVAGSGMGQGQANINVRSDVTMGVEGSRSTPTNRVQQIAELATDRLPEIRKCYRELSMKRPTASGAVALRLTFAEGTGAPAVEVKEKPGTDPEVIGCVRKPLEKGPFRKIERPAAAVLRFEFDNSRAKGESEMAERRAVAEQVVLKERSPSGFEASWQAPDGKVSFRVGRADGQAGIESALVAVRKSFAAFADCRRRSAQGGRSPKGELEVRVELRKAGPRTTVSGSTVPHPRAIPCIERALKGVAFDKPADAQTLELTISFAGPEADANPETR